MTQIVASMDCAPTGAPGSGDLAAGRSSAPGCRWWPRTFPRPRRPYLYRSAAGQKRLRREYQS